MNTDAQATDDSARLSTLQAIQTLQQDQLNVLEILGSSSMEWRRSISGYENSKTITRAQMGQCNSAKPARRRSAFSWSEEMFQPSFGPYFGRLVGPDLDGTGCMPGGLSPCGPEAGAPPDCVSHVSLGRGRLWRIVVGLGLHLR